MKLYFSLIFLLLPFYAFSMTDAQYEKWLHRIYLKHYKDPISYSDWNNKIQNLPQTYQLKFRDNFWDLSGDWFKDSLYWSKIWVVNPEVENPHRIFEGDFIKLDPLTLSSAVNAPFSADIQDQFPGISAPPDFSKPALKEEEMPPSLPDIPLLDFKSELDLSGLDVSKPPNKLYIPYYISGAAPASDGSIAAAESYGRFFGVSGDSVILRLSRNTPLGAYFTVFDSVKLSFFSREYQIQIKAVLKVTSYIRGSGLLYKAQVVTALEPILLEDSLFKGLPPSYTFSKTKLGGSNGEIIGSPYKGISILSTGQLVYLNKGSDDGLYAEDSFYIAPQSKTGPLFKRPYSYEGSYVGMLKVIRAAKDKSTAVILSAKESIYIGDRFTGLMKPIDLEPIEEAERLEQGQNLLEDFEEVVETPPDFIDENIQDPREQKDKDLLEEFNSEEKDDLFDEDPTDEELELEKERLEEELKPKTEINLKKENTHFEDKELVGELEDEDLEDEDLEDEDLEDEDLEDEDLEDEDLEDEDPEDEDLEDEDLEDEDLEDEDLEDEDLEDEDLEDEDPENEELTEYFENEKPQKKPVNELEELEEIDVL